VYASVLRLDPAHRGAMIGLGELALRRGDVDQALQHLHQAENLVFHDNEVHEKLARAYQRRGDETAARRHAALAADHPHLAPIHDPDLAARDEEAVSSKALSSRALAQVRRGAHAEALATFRTLLAAQPQNARYRANYAGALHQAGSTAEALAEFEEALRLSSTDPETFAAYAVALLDAGRPAEAERHAREALRLNPQADEPHHTLGSIRQQQGRLAEAEAEFRRAISLNAVHARSYNNLGNVLAAQGRLDDARAAWQSAVDCGLHVPEAVYNLAMLSYLAGDMAAAAATLAGGLERYGEQPPLLAGLAAIRATAPDAGDRNGVEAIALLKRLTAITGEPDAPTADLLAAAQAEAGRLDDAVATATQALKLARSAGDAALAAQIEARLALYRDGRPYHQQPGHPYRPPQPPTRIPPGWRR
jgi:Flp pilus assembly protein TadD